jgi:YHS domain-containing protein
VIRRTVVPSAGSLDGEDAVDAPRRLTSGSLFGSVIASLGAALLLILLLLGPASAEPLPNTSCPVQPDEEALEEHVVEYAGKKIYFCCERCVAKFLRDPKAYLARVPQLAGVAVAQAPPPVVATIRETARLPAQRRTFVERLEEEPILVGTAGAVLITFLVTVLLRRRFPGAARPGARIAAMALVLAGGAVVYAVDKTADRERAAGAERDLREQLRLAQIKDSIHFATFHDFGMPPIPAKPPLPAQVVATYYRGNDERNPKLFNNGNYRTSTFQLSLESGGAPLTAGGVASGHVSVRFEIQRAPFTPDFFFDDSQMNRIFLTRESDPYMGMHAPVPDRVPLTVAERLQRWVATYDLGQVPASGPAQLDGIVYVCEEHPGGGRPMEGARFHYGLQYALKFQDGKLVDGSDLWMGALYRTRKVLQWRLPLHEWFSYEPIPVLPAKNVDDPMLLGIKQNPADPK